MDTKTRFPIAFVVDEDAGAAPLVHAGPGTRRVTLDCRLVAGHEKEAVVHDSADPVGWRLLSDEGRQLHGTDLAPFPLGYFNAGLATDLLAQLGAGERARLAGGSPFTLVTGYGLVGSFARGDGEGSAEAPEIRLAADAGALLPALQAAAARSPAFGALAHGVAASFTLTVNGKRIGLGTLAEEAEAAMDPFLRHPAAPVPAPATGGARDDVVRKTGVVEDGAIRPAPVATASRTLRQVMGRVRVPDASRASTETWLALPGVSHFTLDGAAGDAAPLPSGLAYLASGVAFCFLTQLSRYTEHMKFGVDQMRLVQAWDFAPGGAGGRLQTHLFLRSRDADVRCEQLMTVAVRTCFLHASLRTRVRPVWVRPREAGVALA